MNFNVKATLPNPYLLAIGALLVFFGIRVHLITVFGSQTPYWDDWAMGTRMAMYLESGFDPTWLYGLANEHRSMFSKMTNLLLFKVNHHQWDPYLTMVFDAFLWGLIGVFLLYIGFRERFHINSWFFAGLVFLLWSYPISLFNTLSTVQTYLYYMIIFVIVGFWLLTHRAFSLKWCCGILMVLAACMTTGGGSFTPVAAASVSIFLALISRENRSQHLITAAVTGLFSVFGMYLILSQSSANVVGSTSMGDFVISMMKMLSWPSSHKTWPSIVFVLPIVLLALGIMRKKIPQTRLATFTLTMAAFGILISVAFAYARGAHGSGPANRHFDFLTIYFVASALALMLIQNRDGVKKIENVSIKVLSFLWIVMAVLAVPYHFSVSHFELSDRAKLVPVQDDIMRRYSVTHNPELFKNRQFREVPFPFPNILQDMVKRLQKTDAIPYSLQSSSMQLNSDDSVFVKDGLVRRQHGRYRGVEPVLGSYNLSRGAQNAVGEYTSELFVARRPYVMIPVTGHLGFEGTSLLLVGETNKRVVEVTPKVVSQRYAHEWRELLVKAPDDQYRIVAKDDSKSLWFAYAAPRSVGRLSYFVDKIIEIGDKIWIIGLLLLVFSFRRKIVSSIGSKEDRLTP